MCVLILSSLWLRWETSHLQIHKCASPAKLPIRITSLFWEAQSIKHAKCGSVLPIQFLVSTTWVSDKTWVSFSQSIPYWWVYCAMKAKGNTVGKEVFSEVRRYFRSTELCLDQWKMTSESIKWQSAPVSYRNPKLTAEWWEGTTHQDHWTDCGGW